MSIHLWLMKGYWQSIWHLIRTFLWQSTLEVLFLFMLGLQLGSIEAILESSWPRQRPMWIARNSKASK